MTAVEQEDPERLEEEEGSEIPRGPCDVAAGIACLAGHAVLANLA